MRMIRGLGAARLPAHFRVMAVVMTRRSWTLSTARLCGPRRRADVARCLSAYSPLRPTRDPVACCERLHFRLSALPIQPCGIERWCFAAQRREPGGHHEVERLFGQRTAVISSTLTALVLCSVPLVFEEGSGLSVKGI
jgi:hypothetical protein